MLICRIHPVATGVIVKNKPTSDMKLFCLHFVFAFYVENKIAVLFH